MRENDAVSPVSFKAFVTRLPQKGMPVAIDADEKQRKALAAEHGLLSVERFHAELLVAPWKRNGVKVSGHVEADITQECVARLNRTDARELAAKPETWLDSNLSETIQQTLRDLPKLSDAIAASYFAHSAISRTGRGSAQ